MILCELVGGPHDGQRQEWPFEQPCPEVSVVREAGVTNYRLWRCMVDDSHPSGARYLYRPVQIESA